MDAFKAAVGPGGMVIAVDADPNAPALQSADKYAMSPRFHEPEFWRFIEDLVVRERIGLVIPLNDYELEGWATRREVFARRGITVAVSDLEVVQVSLDKWATFCLLREAGLPVPITCLGYDEALDALELGTMTFPVVVKPRWGSGSVNLGVANSRSELNWMVQRADSTCVSRERVDGSRVLVQEFIKGIEWGVDLVHDFSGSFVTVWTKRKLAMRAGETDRACTKQSDSHRELARRVGEVLRPRGITDLDLIDGMNGSVVIDVNPRFGGGYPFSHLAGADLPSAMVAWASGATPDPFLLEIQENVIGAKTQQLVMVGS